VSHASGNLAKNQQDYSNRMIPLAKKSLEAFDDYYNYKRISNVKNEPKKRISYLSTHDGDKLVKGTGKKNEENLYEVFTEGYEKPKQPYIYKKEEPKKLEIRKTEEIPLMVKPKLNELKFDSSKLDFKPLKLKEESIKKEEPNKNKDFKNKIQPRKVERVSFGTKGNSPFNDGKNKGNYNYFKNGVNKFAKGGRAIETEGREPVFSEKGKDGKRKLLYYNPLEPTHEKGGVKAIVTPKGNAPVNKAIEHNWTNDVKIFPEGSSIVTANNGKNKLALKAYQENNHKKLDSIINSMPKDKSSSKFANGGTAKADNEYMDKTLNWEHENYGDYGFTSNRGKYKTLAEARKGYTELVEKKGLDKDLPKTLKVIAGDFAFNHAQDPRLGLLQTAGVIDVKKRRELYNQKDSKGNSVKTDLDEIWKDNKDKVIQQYYSNQDKFLDNYKNVRKDIYKNTNADSTNKSGTALGNNYKGKSQQEEWNKRIDLIDDYARKTYKQQDLSDYTNKNKNSSLNTKEEKIKPEIKPIDKIRQNPLSIDTALTNESRINFKAKVNTGNVGDSFENNEDTKSNIPETTPIESNIPEKETIKKTTVKFKNGEKKENKVVAKTNKPLEKEKEKDYKNLDEDRKTYYDDEMNNYENNDEEFVDDQQDTIDGMNSKDSNKKVNNKVKPVESVKKDKKENLPKTNSLGIPDKAADLLTGVKASAINNLIQGSKSAVNTVLQNPNFQLEQYVDKSEPNRRAAMALAEIKKTNARNTSGGNAQAMQGAANQAESDKFYDTSNINNEEVQRATDVGNRNIERKNRQADIQAENQNKSTIINQEERDALQTRYQIGLNELDEGIDTAATRREQRKSDEIKNKYNQETNDRVINAIKENTLAHKNSLMNDAKDVIDKNNKNEKVGVKKQGSKKLKYKIK
jgi:hypothetical protein